MRTILRYIMFDGLLRFAGLNFTSSLYSADYSLLIMLYAESDSEHVPFVVNFLSLIRSFL